MVQKSSKKVDNLVENPLIQTTSSPPVKNEIKRNNISEEDKEKGNKNLIKIS